MTFATKVTLAQAPLAFCMIVVGVLSYQSISLLGRSSDDILRENYRSVIAAQRMNESIERLDREAIFRLLGHSGDPGATVLEHQSRFESELKAQEDNITEPGEREATELLRAVWNHYQKVYVQYPREAPPEAQRVYYQENLHQAFLAVTQAASEILRINQDAMVEKSYRARAAANRATRATIVMFAVALILGLAISSVLTHRLLRPLSSLSQAARRIGEGDLEMRVRVVGKDEVARLAEDFNTMAARLVEYRQSSLGELLQAQLAMQAAIDSIPDPILILGAADDIQNVNRAAQELLEIDAGSAAKDLWRFVPPAVKEVVERLAKHVRAGKGAYSPSGFEETVRVPFVGGDRFFLPRATPVYGGNQQLVATTLILQDVTRLRRFEELRNDVVATVAHEFKTPLTSLHMAIHLCLDQRVGPLTDKQSELLYAAREDCSRLQTLVDDLLDLSRIQTGRVEMQRRPVRARELLEAALSAHKIPAEERSIRLLIDPPPPDLEVLADTNRLAIVLANLITNAIRHTPAGGQIELRARPVGAEVRFEVTDTGEGIPLEFRERIFEKFFQVPGTKAGAAGLGLTIAKEIVLAHEGKIGVDSDLGKGSTFWFTLQRSAP
jgi:signal transduction histidine kinase